MAEELEDFENPTKRRRIEACSVSAHQDSLDNEKEEEGAGRDMLRKFLSAVSDVPMDSMSSTDAFARVSNLRKQYLDESNAYVRQVLSDSSM